MLYGYRGDRTTIIEAIEVHEGEARPVRDAFMAPAQADKDSLIELLKRRQVLPPQD